MPAQIRKRSGEIVPYDLTKISAAILGAGREVHGEKFTAEKADALAKKVETKIEETFTDGAVATVEEIQDLVEEVLMAEKRPKTAKAYILYRAARAGDRDETRAVLNGKTTSLPFDINGLRNIAKVWLDHNPDGTVAESPEEMFRRISTALAGIEEKWGVDEKTRAEHAEKFYEMLTKFEFSAGGRTMRNAGADTPIVPNCIVLHPGDDLESIFQTLKEGAVLQQAGAGLGFPWHLLRPAGTRAKRTKGVASGPVSFLKIYDSAFGIIKQQGRHGANMGVMRVDHPDILEFLDAKKDENAINNFNLSVGITDEFMRQAVADSPEPWMTEWQGEKMLPRRIFRNHKGAVIGIDEVKMTAREILDELVERAWGNGEPGVVFLDAVNRDNPVPGDGPIHACNPCGEQFLHDGDVCNLGSIHLVEFVRADEKDLDWDRLREVTRLATRFLDNVVELIRAPSERVMSTVAKNRRIGIGIIALGDMLFRLRIPYDSAEGQNLAGKIMQFISDESHKMSEELAVERGAFPNIGQSIFKDQTPRRNAATTTIAPTGNTSVTYNRTGGCEPAFALAYKRNTQTGGGTSFWFNPWLEKALKSEGLWTPELKEKICAAGTIQTVAEIPDWMKKVFVTAMDISPEDHVRMQAALQAAVDNSISKTVNFPHSATRADVFAVYKMAWENGCKGCTVYRDGSRQFQILEVGEGKKSEDPGRKPSSVVREEEDEPAAPKSKNPTECPVCKSKLAPGEGCVVCLNCGWSKCS